VIQAQLKKFVLPAFIIIINFVNQQNVPMNSSAEAELTGSRKIMEPSVSTNNRAKIFIVVIP